MAESGLHAGHKRRLFKVRLQEDGFPHFEGLLLLSLLSRGVEDDDFLPLQPRQKVLLEETQFGREFRGNDFVLPKVDRNLSREMDQSECGIE